MATTSPMRMIECLETPPAPRYGPKYDIEPRYFTRSGQNNGFFSKDITPEPESRDGGGQSKTAPVSNQMMQQYNQSNTLSLPTPPTNLNTKKSFSIAQPQTQSPTSPAFPNQSHETSFTNSSFGSKTSSTNALLLNNSTVMGAGMLPTPVKTPRKNTAKGLNNTARALFQDHTDSLTETLMPTPRKLRQSRRNNGFSLQGLSSETEAGPGGVEIYTDSRDRVPELDMSDDNPFVDHPQPAVSSPVPHFTISPQKRKLRSSRKVDAQVEEALVNEEGMVYVFRGKKFFKKFKDSSDEEAAQLSDTMGDHPGVSAADVKPLTRRSIKPKRLFQTAEQIRVREAELAEEMVTDVEEEHEAVTSQESRLPSIGTPVTNLSTLDIGKVDDTTTPAGQVATRGINIDAADPPVRSGSFGLWKRGKPRTGSPTRSSNRGRKRDISTQDVDAGAEAVKRPRRH